MLLGAKPTEKDIAVVRRFRLRQICQHAGVDGGDLRGATEQFHQLESELQGGAGGLARDDRTIDHHWCGTHLASLRRQFRVNARMTGHFSSGQNTRRAQDCRCRTDRSQQTVPRLQYSDDLPDPRVLPEVRRSGQTARQNQHIEILGVDFIERAIREVPGLAGRFNRSGLSTRHSDGHTRSAQDINDCDRFDFLKTRGEWNQDTFHGASLGSGGVTLRRRIMDWADVLVK